MELVIRSRDLPAPGRRQVARILLAALSLCLGCGDRSQPLPVAPDIGEYKRYPDPDHGTPLSVWLFNDNYWLLEQYSSDFHAAVGGVWRQEEAAVVLLPFEDEPDFPWFEPPASRAVRVVVTPVGDEEPGVVELAVRFVKGDEETMMFQRVGPAGTVETHPYWEEEWTQ